MDATSNHLIAWLLDGDAAIQYQVYCDLLGQQRPDIRARIVTEGWGAQFLAARQPAGHWGRGFPGCSALDVLKAKRRKDGAWPLQAKHPGQAHFDMETPGQPGRWNTLRALRVLKRFRAGEP